MMNPATPFLVAFSSMALALLTISGLQTLDILPAYKNATYLLAIIIVGAVVSLLMIATMIAHRPPSNKNDPYLKTLDEIKRDL